MKKILALLILSYCLLPIAHCQLPAYWQQQVNYKIDVTLNDVDNSIDGFVKMDYFNNSPDTLHFIWIHLWPNAYKNDRTAFSDQTLENGSTAFYFSDNDKRGYINRLNFRVNTITAKTEDHPQHQDIIKLILPVPLPPKSSCKIETPFHVKLPYNFSRGGHVGQAFQLTQWYPKPAVYDSKGWHPIPYLDQGEFYSEFGNYEVQITVPKNYVVAATGDLQEQSEKDWLKKRKQFSGNDDEVSKKKKATIVTKNTIPSAAATKTLHYVQNNVHDFAWFADKTFSVKTEAFQLPSGKPVTAYIFYYANHEAIWANSIALTKQAILTKSKWVSEYPYNVVSVVEDEKGGGGMEYPTITFLSSGGNERTLDYVINHEAGHNWFYGILATNERNHAWMDEGMNTYYDNRYAVQQYGKAGIPFPIRPAFLQKKMPDNVLEVLLREATNTKTDQPIETSSEKFSVLNYAAVGYEKTGDWMALLQNTLGTAMFDSCMKTYYVRWGFKHPYPEDFKKVVADVSGKNVDSIFSLLNTKGSIAKPVHKSLRLTAFYNLKETDKYNYIAVAPVIGFNFYDRWMLGAVIHNYTLPATKFQFVIVPLYSSKNKQFNGIGRAGYSWYPGSNGQKVEVSLSAASFNYDNYADSTGTVRNLRFYKFVPSLKYVFAKKDPRSSITKFIQWKTFIIDEEQLDFYRDTTRQIDIITYPVQTRYLNQLQFVIDNNRVLYPYTGTLQVEQGDGFVRTNFTGNYYFNYAKGGGLNVRFFAGKFFYTGDKTFLTQFKTDAYHLNMTGAKGNEDYTYNGYFIGRNEFDHYGSQQIMIRDGGFKVRTDLLSDKIGKSDNWLTAANFTTDIPKNINPLSVLPIKLPIKAFFDVGTYAEAWQKDAPTGRFVYDAGLQLSLFKDIVNVYFPLLYSKVYKDYMKSTFPENRFIKNVSFSIDIQNITLKKLFPQIPF